MSRWMTRDRWAAVVCFIIVAFIVAVIPSQTSDRPIPGARGFDLLTGAFFPKLAVALFLAAAVWLFIEGRPGRGQASADPGGAPDDEPPGLTLRDLSYAVALTAGVLVYVQLLGWLGYLLSTIPAVAVLALVCGQRSWTGLLLGAVLFPLVVYYSFAHIFMVPLPRVQLW
jgi:hypothetical protein